MTPENIPWTTFLGKAIQKMQEKDVSENCITALENELIIAIQAVRHVRRCYERPPSSTKISK